MAEYSPKFWKHGRNITAGQFCDYVKENIPPDAVLCVCGDAQIYLHLTVDGSVFSLDHDSLSDLTEYEGYETRELHSSSEDDRQE